MTSGRREAAAACGLLLLLLAAAYANVVFLGRSLVFSDNYNPMDYRLLEQNYGPRVVPAHVWNGHNLLAFPNFHDPAATWWQWEPSGEYLRRALRHGEWPWWDPHVGGGVPAMANLTPAFFFPPYFLLVVLGNGALLKNVYFLAVLLTAAFCSYLLLRRHELSREASFAGAVAVLFCGGLNQNVGSFIGQTAACLPVALLLTRWFVERPTWRRAALLAAGYAAIALASFPPLLFAAFGLSAAYAAVLIAAGEGGRSAGRAALRYAAGAALALGLVAFYYLPAFAVMREVPQTANVYRGAGLESLRWPALSQLLSPTLMGGEKVFADPPMRDIGKISVPYLGLVALLLAGLAGPVGKRETRLFTWLLAAAVALIALKLAGVQPVQSLGLLPGLRTIHFAHYFGIPLNILLGLGAGIGLERLLAGRVSRARVWIVVLGVGLVLLAMPLVAFVRGTFAHAWALAWLKRWYLLAALLLVAAAPLLALAGEREPGARRRRLAGGAILALLALEGVANTYYPRQARWDVWRHPTPYVRELLARKDAGRIYTARALTANAASAYGLFQFDSMMTFNAPRMFDLYKRYAAPGSYLFLREATLLPPDGVLDAANVRLLAIHESQPELWTAAGQRGYRAFFADGYMRLFERDSEPRYYFTSQYRRLKPPEALAAMAERRPQREILVEATPPFPSVPNDGREPPVRLAGLSLNRVELRVHAARPGLVYCSESHFPGWHATVNGRPTRILAANYAFRAVPVPAGDSTIELRYRPPGLTTGVWISLAAALILLLLALWRPARLPVSR